MRNELPFMVQECSHVINDSLESDIADADGIGRSARMFLAAIM
jgi:hypothetical protein